jgi:hypothetical protein
MTMRDEDAGEVPVSKELSPLEWALAYARVGWHVLPLHTMRDGCCSCRNPSCESPGKHPIAFLVKHGLKDATTDEMTIRRWFKKWPDANVGIATGRASALLVVDVDGDEGEKLLAEISARIGPLPEGLCVKTGKGRHLYFKYPKDGPPIGNLGGGKLDLRGDGGYVVAPPSMHASGRQYQWLSTKALSGIAPEHAEAMRELIKQLSTGAHGKICFVAEADTSLEGLGKLPARLKPLALSGRKLITGVGNVSTPPPCTEAEVDRIRDALKAIPADARDAWLTVGMALHWLTSA